MPIYEYMCPKCGKFEDLKAHFEKISYCPDCDTVSRAVMSAPYKSRVSYKENLPLGNKSRGKYIPPEGNRMGILVPSFGALDKEEVEYVAEGALEKETERAAKNIRRTNTKERLENVTRVALNTPQGKRAATIKNILGG
jgi:putative FmdB family regulatory protein